MAVQPTYHWQFAEREGSLAKDSVSGVEGRFQGVLWEGHGRIGHAIRVRGKEGRVNLGNVAGQFGTSDFTIAFGINLQHTHDQNDVDIIGNRSVMGHGNWVSLRTMNKRELFFEVDEDSNGKNYATARTGRVLTPKKWQHIAVVREGPTLKIYVDGSLAAEGTSETGVANIQNGVDLKLGHWRRHAHSARYEDLRIYHTALNALQIQSLIPPVNRLLRPGQIELIAIDDAAVVLTQDMADLAPYSPQFRRLRLGPDTGATLYKGANFRGVSQKLYTGIPDTRLTRLEAAPRSIHIWSSVGEPFTGKWIIAAPNGQYLSRNNHTLTTAPDHAADELFIFHYNPNFDRPLLLPVTDEQISLLNVGNAAAVLMVDDSEGHRDAFSIVHPSQNQWLTLNPDNSFSWTQQREDRAIFHRAAKIADHEGQVGELSVGEVALYEHQGYRGRTWILSDSDPRVTGNFTSLRSFQGLDNRITSLRLGPDTGVTVFADENLTVSEANRETDVEDFVDDVPDLRNGKAQIGNDTISSLTIFRTVAPDTMFTGVTSKLSQDYRMVDDKLEEFSSYRTILRFAPDASAVEVSATDLTTIEVEDTLHEIDEVRSVTLRPNAMHRIMITSEADGLSTPGLKFRTSAMAENEFVVIFPDQEAHQQIAELEDDALWNATDAKGNLIVDRTAHTQSEVASVQNTIKRVMATTVPTDDTPAPDTDVFERNGLERTVSKRRVVVSTQTNQGVFGAALGDPWTIHFAPRPSTIPEGSAGLVMPSDAIWEEPVNQHDFAQRLAQVVDGGSAASVPGAVGTIGPVAGLRIGGFFRGIRDAVKNAVSVTIGFVNDAVSALVDIGGRIVRFVLDTAKKVADFVAAVVEKVVEGIKQFIEFLQFLFDWDDILATQRYLVRVLNAGFDSAVELTEAAKPKVSAFVTDLQEGVEDGMNLLVRTLGGDPSEVQTSDFELPEAVEWFLSKVLGGSRQPGAGIIPNAATNPSGDSELENFVSHFIDAFEEAVGAGLRVSEGVIESITALIANPRQPQLALIVMIETFRDAIIQMLESAESVALGLLDVIGAAIEQLKNLLNTEIKIPLISDLFELLGAGKLTILNLSTLLLAIPVTVVSKIVTGRNLFANAAVPLTAATQPEARLVVASVVAGQTDEPDTIGDLRTDLLSTITVTMADAVNQFISGILDFADKPEPGGDSSESSAGSSTGEGLSLANFATFGEGASMLLSLISFAFSSPFQSAPEPTRENKRERILWGVRSVALAVDFVVLVDSHRRNGAGQRLRRLNGATSIGWALYSVIDMILFSMYLAAVEEDNKAIKNSGIIAEVFSWLPNVVAAVRGFTLPEPFATVAHVGHAVTSVVATVSTLATGSVLIREANKALQEAEAKEAEAVAA